MSYEINYTRHACTYIAFLIEIPNHSHEIHFFVDILDYLCTLLKLSSAYSGRVVYYVNTTFYSDTVSEIMWIYSFLVHTAG